MKLSKNFTLEEMIESETARELNIHEQFNPPEGVIDNLIELCEECLQPLRDKLGVPIRVTSGWRCQALNTLVGGSENSAHLSGFAADIVCEEDMTLLLPGLTTVSMLTTMPGNAALFYTLAKKRYTWRVDQLIYEHGSDQNPEWVHVAIQGLGRREVLRAQRLQSVTGERKTTYAPLSDLDCMKLAMRSAS